MILPAGDRRAYGYIMCPLILLKEMDRSVIVYRQVSSVQEDRPSSLSLHDKTEHGVSALHQAFSGVLPFPVRFHYCKGPFVGYSRYKYSQTLFPGRAD